MGNSVRGFSRSIGDEINPLIRSSSEASATTMLKHQCCYSQNGTESQASSQNTQERTDAPDARFKANKAALKEFILKKQNEDETLRVL
ncbi:hypothetical protein PABG_04818 [Paracoccidioides brasiliensis Pb03]|nr:hypothetical protein PABG_04818 [Paracoccidioides brasiliensis Pb03]